MALTAGTPLGRYTIRAPLGAGGMGEVYLATDARLDRTVAVKVLSPAVAADPDFRARFTREARAIAALQHPNICVLFDVADDNGVDFLVMEHLDGETLASRLGRGPLSAADVLRYGREVASALAAAHRQGFVHRDLKPGNIMLTASGSAAGVLQAKLLDFGLAKPMTAHDAAGATATAVTGRGVALGTPGYIAPEQLLGQAADARSDIYALGAVIFEMATGRRAAGEAVDPALTRLEAPPLLAKIVHKCLEKDPGRRWHSAADIVDALDWVGESAPSAAAPPISRPWSRLVWIGGALLIAAAATAAIAAVAALGGSLDRQTLRLDIVAPRGTTFTPRDRTWHPQFALSRDGRSLAFIASEPGKPPLLWVRALDTGAARPLLGTEDASGPFWSPDGTLVAFFARGRLKKVAIAGTPPQDLAPVAVDTMGGSWSDDGTIVFSGAVGDGLSAVRADGGPVTAATTIDEARGETGHRWPQFLRDGQIIFFVRSTREDSGLYIAAPGSRDKRLVMRSGTSAVYAEPGVLLFEDQGNLVAQPFDASQGRLTGSPATTGDRLYALSGPSYLPLSAGGNATLAYWNGGPPDTLLAWHDRRGQVLQTIGRDAYDSPVLSPDGRTILVTRRTEDMRNELWRIDESGRATQLAVPGFPIWGPDSQRIVHSEQRTGYPELYERTIPAGEPAPLLGSTRHWAVIPGDWSHDGRWILYSVTERAGWDIWAFDRQSRKAMPIITSPANQVQPRLSPDGRWLAYASDESGVWKVSVAPFPGPGGTSLISPDGGAQPQWRADGRELFFITADGFLASSAIQAEPFEAGPPTRLFGTQVPPMLAPFRPSYGVAPDGQRFLLANVVPESEPGAIRIVLGSLSAVPAR